MLLPVPCGVSVPDPQPGLQTELSLSTPWELRCSHCTTGNVPGLAGPAARTWSSATRSPTLPARRSCPRRGAGTVRAWWLLPLPLPAQETTASFFHRAQVRPDFPVEITTALFTFIHPRGRDPGSAGADVPAGSSEAKKPILKPQQPP